MKVQGILTQLTIRLPLFDKLRAPSHGRLIVSLTEFAVFNVQKRKVLYLMPYVK